MECFVLKVEPYRIGGQILGINLCFCITFDQNLHLEQANLIQVTSTNGTTTEDWLKLV